jgi:uncharacterized membrane protein (DUF2068 family)
MNLEQKTSGADPKARPRGKIAGLRVIALIKIAKALLLTGLAFGFFRSIDRDLGETVRQITFHLRIDPENTVVRVLLEKIANIDPHTLRTIGLITFVYAAELYIEGIGLWLNKTWAKYMLIVATGGFLPFEARACIASFSWERLILILLNLVALLYVVWVIWYQKHPKKE